jgi:hypothetical protein
MRAIKEGTITGINLDMDSKPQFCEICVQAKATRQPIPKVATSERPTEYGGKVVVDLKGPMSVKSLGGASYAMTPMDLSTHEERGYFIKAKSDAFENYKKYEAWVKTQRGGAVIKILGSDGGGEFTSNAFTDHLEKAGTIRHLTVHDTPSSNGIAERAQRTHAEQTRAMLIESGLPKFLWAEGWRHSIWLRNRSPTSALPNFKTPMEAATKKKPNLSKLLAWGTTIWLKVKGAKDLERHAIEVRFVGYDVQAKGFRVYWPGKRKVTVERDVYFSQQAALEPGTTSIEGEWDDDDILATPEAPPAKTASKTPPADAGDVGDKAPEGITDTVEPPIPENLRQSPPPEPNPAPAEQPPAPVTPAPEPPHARKPRSDGLIEPEPNTGRGHRARKPPGFYHKLNEGRAGAAELGTEDVAALFEILEEEPDDDSDLQLDVDVTAFCSQVVEFAMVTESVPMSLREAIKGPDAKHWEPAAQAEFTQLEKLDTWDIVEAPPGASIIRCHYVLTLKRDAFNAIQKYKVRLVANGQTQVYGINYTDTYAPVVRHATLRVLLTLAATNDWEIHQADVKNAYLNAPLTETIYMAIPEFYEKFSSKPLPSVSPGRRLVCKLKKGLYGTKQGGRTWYTKMRDTFISLGYTVLQADQAVFISRDKSTIVAAATDDFTIIGKTVADVSLIKKQLNEHFETVDLGEINWLLGIHIQRDRIAKTITLSQTAYIEQILAHMGMSDAAPNLVPMEPGVDLNLDSPAVSSQVLTSSETAEYCKGVGFQMYATITHPEITFHVSTLSQFMHAPRSTHMKVLRRILKYLSGTRHHRLVLGGSDLTLTGYSDADWSSQLHRHSISGYAFFLGNSLVDWSSKKQPLITLSTTESEYVALTHASKNLLWLRKLLIEISVPLSGPTALFCDNQSAIILTKDGAFHARTKHIDNRFHFIRQTVANGHATIPYCKTNDMIADIFTKSLARPKFTHFRELLGVVEYPASA